MVIDDDMEKNDFAPKPVIKGNIIDNVVQN